MSATFHLIICYSNIQSFFSVKSIFNSWVLSKQSSIFVLPLQQPSIRVLLHNNLQSLISFTSTFSLCSPFQPSLYTCSPFHSHTLGRKLMLAPYPGHVALVRVHRCCLWRTIRQPLRSSILSNFIFIYSFSNVIVFLSFI